MADFFSSVFLSRVDDNGDICSKESVTEANIIGTMNVVDFEPDVVLNRLKKLNVYKSSGPDNIQAKILFECRESIYHYLSLIFSKSFEWGVIPNVWKESITIAVFKKGDRKDAKNYRPVALTCIVCKLMESIIKDALISHLIEYDLLDRRQFGFVQGKSTTLQLLKMMDEWTKAVDKGYEIDVVYTDFEKAFDRVSHGELIDKMNKCGLNEKLIEWVRNYLDGRKFRVRVNNGMSRYCDVKSGVPQGSVIGPVLFLIYINDLFNFFRDENGAKMYMYADDAKLFKVIGSDSDKIILQKGLNDLSDWCMKSSVKLNEGKCVVMNLGCLQSNNNFDYKIGSHSLNYVDQVIDLGVIFDSTLKFYEHIHCIVKKAYSLLGLINRNFKYVNNNIFLILYKSLVRSQLEYSACVWSPWTIREMEEIERVQKRATKMVRGCEGLDYENRLRFLCLPTLRYRRIRGDLIMMFNILRSEDHRCLPEMMRATGRTRGHGMKISTAPFHTNLRKNYFINRILNIWNSLTDEVVDCSNVNEFKNKLDKFLMNAKFKYDWRAEL